MFCGHWGRSFSCLQLARIPQAQRASGPGRNTESLRPGPTSRCSTWHLEFKASNAAQRCPRPPHHGPHGPRTPLAHGQPRSAGPRDPKFYNLILLHAPYNLQHSEPHSQAREISECRCLGAPLLLLLAPRSHQPPSRPIRDRSPPGHLGPTLPTGAHGRNSRTRAEHGLCRAASARRWLRWWLGGLPPHLPTCQPWRSPQFLHFGVGSGEWHMSGRFLKVQFVCGASRRHCCVWWQEAGPGASLTSLLLLLRGRDLVAQALSGLGRGHGKMQGPACLVSLLTGHCSTCCGCPLGPRSDPAPPPSTARPTGISDQPLKRTAGHAAAHSAKATGIRRPWPDLGRVGDEASSGALQL